VARHERKIGAKQVMPFFRKTVRKMKKVVKEEKGQF